MLVDTLQDDVDHDTPITADVIRSLADEYNVELSDTDVERLAVIYGNASE